MGNGESAILGVADTHRNRPVWSGPEDTGDAASGHGYKHRDLDCDVRATNPGMFLIDQLSCVRDQVFSHSVASSEYRLVCDRCPLHLHVWARQLQFEPSLLVHP